MSNTSFKKRHLEYQEDLGFHGMDQQEIFRKRCGLMKKYNTMSVMHWESFVKRCNLGVLTQLVFLFVASSRIAPVFARVLGCCKIYIIIYIY